VTVRLPIDCEDGRSAVPIKLVSEPAVTLVPNVQVKKSA
jgi:hypothetical protein